MAHITRRQLDDRPDDTARFELMANLYYIRFGRLAPGKSDWLRNSNDQENRARYDDWMLSGQANRDLLTYALHMEALIADDRAHIELLEDRVAHLEEQQRNAA